MTHKLPADAFAYYFSIGPERSYKAVADKYQCSERAVAKLAAKEDWQARIEEIEAKARARSDQQLLESLEEMNLRHIKTARMLQARGIEALQTMKIKSIPDALKAVQVGIEKERLIRGEPSERIDIEELIRQEFSDLMVDEEEERGEEDPL